MGGDRVRIDAPLPDLWDDEHAASLDHPGLLLYRSNLLGSDLRITNFGGGNTSAKLTSTDPLTGAPTPITPEQRKEAGIDVVVPANTAQTGRMPAEP